jgi:hypothetical protein
MGHLEKCMKREQKKNPPVGSRYHPDLKDDLMKNGKKIFYKTFKS